MIISLVLMKSLVVTALLIPREGWGIEWPVRDERCVRLGTSHVRGTMYPWLQILED